MWAIKNHTPYAATGMWGRDREGVHEWICAVKETCIIRRDVRHKLADEQPAPLLLPEYHGEPGESSLRYEAELVGMKPTTDILLNGTAYAPGGRPAHEFHVSMHVGAV